MASRKALLIAATAMTVVVVGALLPATASAAANYVVGDADGWDVNVDYKAWTKGKTFHVGDTLEFVYQTDEATHNVVWVDKASYAACTVPSDAVVMSTGSGDDKVVFTAAGQLFFICSIEGHCQSGMKLAVNVQ